MSRQTVKPKSVWTGVGGLRMHARVSTDSAPAGAPAVVLVHGIGVASRYFVPTAERLAPRCRVHALDLPGFGDSEGPPRALTIPELADSLAAWMEATGLDRATLLGNSVGCQVVADLAARHPERVERAVLVGPAFDPLGRTAREQVRRWLLNNSNERPSQLPISIGDYQKAGIGRVWCTFRYALEDRIEEKLPRVRVPTLVVRGGEDPIVPQRWAEEAARLLPQGRLLVIPGAAHTVNYNSPARLAVAVLAFLCDSRRPGEEEDP
jgi:2-hydroxy-6-oxonona-2,4-dienedioate hydrolase